MSINEYNKVRDRTERVLELAHETPDPEIKSSLAVLACVLTSGMIEASCRHYLGLFTERRSNPAISAFVIGQLRYFSNPKTNELIDLLRTFDSDRGLRVAAIIDDQARTAIDSVVGRRHQIAHGEYAGLGLSTMTSWHSAIVPVIRAIEQHFS